MFRVIFDASYFAWHYLTDQLTGEPKRWRAVIRSDGTAGYELETCLPPAPVTARNTPSPIDPEVARLGDDCPHPNPVFVADMWRLMLRKGW